MWRPNVGKLPAVRLPFLPLFQLDLISVDLTIVPTIEASSSVQPLLVQLSQWEFFCKCSQHRHVLSLFQNQHEGLWPARVKKALPIVIVVTRCNHNDKFF